VALQHVDAKVLQGILSRLTQEVEKTDMVLGTFAKLDPPTPGWLGSAKAAVRKGHIVCLEGVLLHLLETCQNPIMLRRKVASQISEVQEELGRVFEGEDFTISACHEHIASKVAQSTSFGKRQSK